jgi:hypothetical protein
VEVAQANLKAEVSFEEDLKLKATLRMKTQVDVEAAQKDLRLKATLRVEAQVGVEAAQANLRLKATRGM